MIWLQNYHWIAAIPADSSYIAGLHELRLMSRLFQVLESVDLYMPRRSQGSHFHGVFSIGFLKGFRPIFNQAVHVLATRGAVMLASAFCLEPVKQPFLLRYTLDTNCLARHIALTCSIGKFK